jgi:hypothetical protein
LAISDGGKVRTLVGGGSGKGDVFAKGGFTVNESQIRVLRDVVLLAGEGFEGQRAFGWTCSRLFFLVVGSDVDAAFGCASARGRSVEARLASSQSIPWSRLGR